MALIKCKDCGKDVSTSATACPHCGAPMKEAQAANSKAALLGCSGCLTVFVALFVLAGVASMCAPKEDKEKARAEQTENMAFIQCRNLVREKLKAPATAEFPLLERQVTNLGDDVYRVVSYVDAQNSFGAKIRNNYTCQIRHVDKEGDAADPRSWEEVEVSISAR